MSEERKPQVFALTEGVMGWMPHDPSDERMPEIISTSFGDMVWLPYNQQGQPTQLNRIVTPIGPIFWVRNPPALNASLAQVRDEIEEIEAKRPQTDVRLVLNSFLPLLLTACLQDAAGQALREAFAIVRAKGAMDYPRQRSKYLESVAEEARLDSLRRFAMTNLYRPLRRGEHVEGASTLAASLSEIFQQFFDVERDLRMAIREILEKGDPLTLRAIARKLNLGKPHKERSRDTGIKKVEALLKRLRPTQTPSQAIAAFAADERAARKEKQIGKQNSRRKPK